MKIQENSGEIVDVFAIYWANFKTIVLGFRRGHGGLMAYDVSTVSIVDPNFIGRFVYYDSGIFHHALIEEGLLDDVLELDEIAYKRFLEILKSEELIDQDFY